MKREPSPVLTIEPVGGVKMPDMFLPEAPRDRTLGLWCVMARKRLSKRTDCACTTILRLLPQRTRFLIQTLARLRCHLEQRDPEHQVRRAPRVFTEMPGFGCRSTHSCAFTLDLHLCPLVAPVPARFGTVATDEHSRARVARPPRAVCLESFTIRG